MDPASGPFGRPAVTGLAAAALVFLAACGSVHGQPASGRTASASTASASTASASPGAARQAVLAAAIRAPRITSAITAVQVKTTSSGTEIQTGTIRYRTKPTLAISEDLHGHGPSPITEEKTVLTRTRMYSDALDPSAGGEESWMDLSPRTFQFQLQDLQERNFTGLAQLFAADPDPHVVRRQTIGGVPATEYAGSFRASDALKALAARTLPASLRKILSARLPGMEDTLVSFHVWLDGQHNVRRAVEVETGGIVTATTINVTAIDQPLRIALPPEPKLPGS
jgi:hypothetical protein